jgi:hypothetical protein
MLPKVVAETETSCDGSGIAAFVQCTQSVMCASVLKAASQGTTASGFRFKYVI